MQLRDLPLAAISHLQSPAIMPGVETIPPHLALLEREDGLLRANQTAQILLRKPKEAARTAVNRAVQDGLLRLPQRSTGGRGRPERVLAVRDLTRLVRVLGCAPRGTSPACRIVQQYDELLEEMLQGGEGMRSATARLRSATKAVPSAGPEMSALEYLRRLGVLAGQPLTLPRKAPKKDPQELPDVFPYSWPSMLVAFEELLIITWAEKLGHATPELTSRAAIWLQRHPAWATHLREEIDHTLNWSSLLCFYEGLHLCFVFIQVAICTGPGDLHEWLRIYRLVSGVDFLRVVLDGCPFDKHAAECATASMRFSSAYPRMRRFLFLLRENQVLARSKAKADDAGETDSNAPEEAGEQDEEDRLGCVCMFKVMRPTIHTFGILLKCHF